MATVLTPIVDVNAVATSRHKKVAEVPVTRTVSASPPVVVDKWAAQRDSAMELLEDIGEDIVVGNHGAFPNLRPTVNLHDMASGDIARGNCWAITNELIEIAGTDYFGDYVDELNINTKKGLSHTGLFVKDGDVEYVVDYTIRQFDEKLDYPFIASIEDWKATVERSYGESFEFMSVIDDEDYDD